MSNFKVFLTNHKNIHAQIVFFVGYYAFRNRHDGSYMLTLFSEVVDAWCTKYESADLMDMLKDVTLKMSEKSFYGPKEYKTVPSVVHKLRKDVIFKAKVGSRLAF